MNYMYIMENLEQLRTLKIWQRKFRDFSYIPHFEKRKCAANFLALLFTELSSIEIKWALQDVSELGYLFHDSPVCI